MKKKIDIKVNLYYYYVYIIIFRLLFFVNNFYIFFFSIILTLSISRQTIKKHNLTLPLVPISLLIIYIHNTI